MDERGFEFLVSAHYEGLYRFALTLTHREQDASDLTQETFYRYATKGSQLRDSSKAKSWLYTTLYRRFLMNRRRQTRFPHAELSEAEDELPVVEANAVDRLDAHFVLQALNSIDETYRVALSLFYLSNHSYKEIAAVLDIPIGTVMSRLSRAKAMLREQLAVAGTKQATKVVPLPSRQNSQNG